MKKFNVKTSIAAVCVVAASFGGMKAYNAINQSEADLLLSENVEALSQGDTTKDRARYIQKSQGFVITGFSGNVAIATKLNLSLGTLIDGSALDVAAKAGLTISGNNVNTYQETCFSKKGANCMCNPTNGFIQCPGSPEKCPDSCG